MHRASLMLFLELEESSDPSESRCWGGDVTGAAVPAIPRKNPCQLLHKLRKLSVSDGAIVFLAKAYLTFPAAPSISPLFRPLLSLSSVTISNHLVLVALFSSLSPPELYLLLFLPLHLPALPRPTTSLQPRELVVSIDQNGGRQGVRVEEPGVQGGAEG